MDLEKIREIAVQRASVQKKKEEVLADRVRLMAKKHLPLWVKVVEQAMCRGDSVSFRLCCKHVSDFFFWRKGSYEWGYYDKEFLDPQIDPNEVMGIPSDALDVYVDELTVLLGEPFRVQKDYYPYQDKLDFEIKWGEEKEEK